MRAESRVEVFKQVQDSIDVSAGLVSPNDLGLAKALDRLPSYERNATSRLRVTVTDAQDVTTYFLKRWGLKFAHEGGLLRGPAVKKGDKLRPRLVAALKGFGEDTDEDEQLRKQLGKEELCIEIKIDPGEEKISKTRAAADFCSVLQGLHFLGERLGSYECSVKRFMARVEEWLDAEMGGEAVSRPGHYEDAVGRFYVDLGIGRGTRRARI